MVTNLGAILAYLYPSADSRRDYRIQDAGDGAGPQLVSWNADRLGAQPTDAQIAAAQLPVAQQAKVAAIDVRTQQLIAAGFSFGGAQFSLATSDQLHLTALFSFSANLTFPVGFTTASNGSFSIPDAGTLKQMAGAALNTVQSAIDAGRALKVQVMAATSTAAVDAVTDTR